MCFFGKKKILKKQQELCDKIDALEREIVRTEAMRQELAAVKSEIVTTVNTAVSVSSGALSDGIRNTLDAVTQNVSNVLGENEKRIGEMRLTVEKSLTAIREDNEKRLTEMKQVVEEKLTASLNERLAQAFSSVNESLAKVNQGLGEMKTLSGGVTDLKKMLGSVKSRGIFGESSLANILANILTEDQYKTQFNLSGRADDGKKIVDFVVILPGQGRDDVVYLPIDAKFPLEDYQRLVAASEIGDGDGVNEASKALVDAIKKQARKIHDLYISIPKTVDFAIMYLPIEGLYAEVVRNAGLLEELRNKCKVIPAGPTTITALLSSLQIGFRTLAVQKSSKEIYDSLLRFKKDFTTFVELLEKAQGQLGTVQNTLEMATKRTGIIQKGLDKVETMAPPALPDSE